MAATFDLKNLGFDPEALRKKYAEERNKRVREDGTAQFIDIFDEYAEMGKDTFVDAEDMRAPIDEETDAVVLGGGLIGLTTAAKLRQAGVDNFRIIEQGKDFGGAWYWNQYPGVRCDIESYVYIPMLEEVGTMPTEKYARGEEIMGHCRRMAEKFGIYERAVFQTEVKTIQWDEPSARWFIRTNRGDLFRARHVMVSSGPLNRPKLAGIPGIRDFKGRAFHTSRWDYAYTGGSTKGGLTGLRGKRVALIGTGATGVQVLPHLPEYAEHVYVFQRTPSTIDRRDNRPTDVAWYTNQKPGWQARRMDNFMLTMLGMPQEENMVGDAWTEVIELISGWTDTASIPEGMTAAQMVQIADYKKMEQLRKRVETLVKDPATAEKLKPWYNLFCKRPCFSDEYLQAFNNPNVTLVDTQGRGVDRITENALEFDGRKYEVDCIIFATGFQANKYTHESGGYDLIGRGGVSLKQKWAKGARTVHGTKVAGFPNFHVVGTLNQAAIAWNYPHVAVRQAEYTANFVARCLDENIRSFDVTEDAEQRWLDELASKRQDMTAFYTECTPSYLNNEGDITSRPAMYATTYHGGPIHYLEVLDEWYTSGFKDDAILTYEENDHHFSEEQNLTTVAARSASRFIKQTDKPMRKAGP